MQTKTSPKVMFGRSDESSRVVSAMGANEESATCNQAWLELIP
jgi:hypothetical protein